MALQLCLWFHVSVVLAAAAPTGPVHRGSGVQPLDRGHNLVCPRAFFPLLLISFRRTAQHAGTPFAGTGPAWAVCSRFPLFLICFSAVLVEIFLTEGSVYASDRCCCRAALSERASLAIMPMVAGPGQIRRPAVC